METTREAISALLMAIWRGVPTAYKSRYRQTIWKQFENEVRAAAYTSSLKKFTSSLCRKLQATIGIDNEERETAEFLLAHLDDRRALKLLREETTFLILMVRVENQERRMEKSEKVGVVRPLQNARGES